MTSLIDSITESKEKDKVILMATKAITEDDVKFDTLWRMLKSEYEQHENSEWLKKATVSLINSMIFQRRLVFGITRKYLRNLLTSDTNWNQTIGMKDANYSLFLKHIFRCKMFEEVKYEKRVGRQIMILKTIHPKLLDLMSINIEEQELQTINFAKMEGEFIPNLEEFTNDYEIFDKPKLVMKLAQAVAIKRPSDYKALSEIKDINKANEERRKLYLEEYQSNRKSYGEL